MEKYEEKIDKLGERCFLGATAQKWISWIFALAALGKDNKSLKSRKSEK